MFAALGCNIKALILYDMLTLGVAVASYTTCSATLQTGATLKLQLFMNYKSYNALRESDKHRHESQKQRHVGICSVSTSGVLGSPTIVIDLSQTLAD